MLIKAVGELASNFSGATKLCIHVYIEESFEIQHHV